MLKRVRQGFTVHLRNSSFAAGSVLDLTDKEYLLIKHQLEDVPEPPEPAPEPKSRTKAKSEA
jgi:hypothetical protein